jgi:hypothetical protein
LSAELVGSPPYEALSSLAPVVSANLRRLACTSTRSGRIGHDHRGFGGAKRVVRVGSDRLGEHMRRRIFVAVAILTALVGSAAGFGEYGTRAGSSGSRGGAPPSGALTELALPDLAVLSAEAEAQSRIQPQVLNERDRVLGVARITLVRPVGLAIPLLTRHQFRAASRAAIAPARSPPPDQL